MYNRSKHSWSNINLCCPETSWGNSRDNFPLLMQIFELIVWVTQNSGFQLNGLQSKHSETETHMRAIWGVYGGYCAFGQTKSVWRSVFNWRKYIWVGNFFGKSLVKGNCWAGKFPEWEIYGAQRTLCLWQLHAKFALH